MAKHSVFVVLSCLFINVSFATTWKHFNPHRNKLSRLLTVESTDFPDQWFQQRLDHFDHINVATWKQRYQKNDQLFVKGGPILLMLGGEGPANADWMTFGLWYDVAKRHNAGMFQLEHRFYGKSHPTADCSVSNLRFLNSEQALADAANFATWLKALYPGAKIYSFGGSYSGALSAWLRQRYPHAIDGSFSASGPYLAQVDFPEYEDTVRQVTETAVPSCFTLLTSALNTVQQMFVNNQKDELKSLFRLCDNLSNDINDLYSLVDNLLDPFDETVQYGDDNRMSHPVFKNAKQICRNMTVWPTALDGLAQVIRVYLSATKEECLEASYKEAIESLRQVDWSSEGVASGARTWVWQTCTEFGYYQTLGGQKTKSPALLPLSFFLQQCSDIYGKQFGDPAFLNQSTANSNIQYGALRVKATRTIIFNGDYDPWSRLSVTYPLAPSHETYTFFVPQAAHCAVLYPEAESDTLALKSARQSIMEIFDQWITGIVGGSAHA